MDINNVATAPLFLMDFPKKKKKREFFMTGVSFVVSLPLSRRCAFRPPRLPLLHASYPRYFVHGTRGERHFKRLSLYSLPPSHHPSRQWHGMWKRRVFFAVSRLPFAAHKGSNCSEGSREPDEKTTAGSSKLFHPRFFAFDLVTSCIEWESGLMLAALRMNGYMRLR